MEKFVAETELDLDGKGGCGGGKCHKNCIAASCTHVESLKLVVVTATKDMSERNANKVYV